MSPSRRWLPAAMALAVSLTVPADARAWTLSMERHLAEQSVRLMPAALREILERHMDEVRRGAAEAAADEGAPGHLLEAGQEGDSLARRLDRLVDETVGMIDGHRPFALVARKMGELAHYAGDLNNPLNLSSADPLERDYAKDYEQYVESNLPKYPLVFNGWESELFEPRAPSPSSQVVHFARKTADRVRGYYEPISRAYAPGNKEPLDRRFGVRSLPFGIGSLSYSNSVTDIARLWLHVWKRAHGDVRGLPLWRPGSESRRPPEGKPGGKPGGKQ